MTVYAVVLGDTAGVFNLEDLAADETKAVEAANELLPDDLELGEDLAVHWRYDPDGNLIEGESDHQQSNYDEIREVTGASIEENDSTGAT